MKQGCSFSSNGSPRRRGDERDDPCLLDMEVHAQPTAHPPQARLRSATSARRRRTAGKAVANVQLGLPFVEARTSGIEYNCSEHGDHSSRPSRGHMEANLRCGWLASTFLSSARKPLGADRSTSTRTDLDLRGVEEMQTEANVVRAYRELPNGFRSCEARTPATDRVCAASLCCRGRSRGQTK